MKRDYRTRFFCFTKSAVKNLITPTSADRNIVRFSKLLVRVTVTTTTDVKNLGGFFFVLQQSGKRCGKAEGFVIFPEFLKRRCSCDDDVGGGL